MKKYSIHLILAILLFTISLSSNAKTHLKVGYLPILDHLILLVSHAQSQFQQIEIETKLFKTWNEIANALEVGVIDAAFMLSPLAMDLFNRKVAIQTILLAHRDGSAITVKKDSVITKVEDLRGKIIAIPHRISTHTALLDSYLRQAGLSLAAVTTKVIAPSDMIMAMQLGKIDAFIVAEPFGSKAQTEGIGQILILTKEIVPHHIECIVVVKREILKANDGAIQEWVNHLIQAGHWIHQDTLENNSRKVAQLTAKKYLPHSEDTIINGLQNPVKRISFTNLNPDLRDFKTIADKAITAALIAPIDLEAFIDSHFYDNAVVQ